jgi:CRISPR-associated protein Cas6/Cse3/CasE subtype I-E
MSNDPNQQHQIIYDLFPQSDIIFLYNNVKTIVISDKLPVKNVSAKVQVIPAYKIGSNLKFRTKCNAITRNSGKDIPIKGIDRIIEWFKKTALECGFEVDLYEVIPLEIQICNHKNQPFPIYPVDFSGTCRVIDEKKFNGTIRYGIKRGKAFGFGLLNILD